MNGWTVTRRGTTLHITGPGLTLEAEVEAGTACVLLPVPPYGTDAMAAWFPQAGEPWGFGGQTWGPGNRPVLYWHVPRPLVDELVKAMAQIVTEAREAQQ